MADKTQDIAQNVVATLAGKVIHLRVQEREAEDELHRGIVQMAAQGASVDSLSEASGLTPERIRKLIEDATPSIDDEMRAFVGLC